MPPKQKRRYETGESSNSRNSQDIGKQQRIERPYSICIRFPGLDQALQFGQHKGYAKRDEDRLDELYQYVAERNSPLGYVPTRRSGKAAPWIVAHNTEYRELEHKKYTYGSSGARLLVVINEGIQCVIVWAGNDHDGNYDFDFNKYKEIIGLWCQGNYKDGNDSKLIERPVPVTLPTEDIDAQQLKKWLPK